MINCIKRSKITGFPNQNRSSRGFIWVAAIDGPVCSTTPSDKQETTCRSFVPTNMTSFGIWNTLNKINFMSSLIRIPFFSLNRHESKSAYNGWDERKPEVNVETCNTKKKTMIVNEIDLVRHIGLPVF